MPKMYARGVSQADGGAPARLSPGDYEFRCSGFEEIIAKSGKPGFKLDLAILDGPDDSKGNSVVGRSFQHRQYIGEPSDKDEGVGLQDRVRNTCDGFGVEINEDDEFELNDFVDSTASAKLKPQRSNPDFLEVSRFYTGE